MRLRWCAGREALNDPLDDQIELFAASDTNADDARRDLAKLLEQLPDRQRLPIIHMKLEGLLVIQAARLCGMSEAAVKVGVHRGLKALAAIIRGRTMKTDELITMLASGVEAVDPHALRRRYALALGLSLAGTTVRMLMLLGARPDIAEAARLMMFWMKFAFPAALLVWRIVCNRSSLATRRASRPGAASNRGARDCSVAVLRHGPA